MKPLRFCATPELAAVEAAEFPVPAVGALVPVAALVAVDAEAAVAACAPTDCCSDCSMLPSRPCVAPTGIWPTLPMLDTL